MQRSNALVMVALLGATLAWGIHARAQSDVAPTNDLPNPYRSTAPWGNLPARGSW